MKITNTKFCPKCGVALTSDMLSYTGKNINTMILDKEKIFECLKCGARLQGDDKKGRKWLVLFVPMFAVMVLIAWEVNIKYPLLWTFISFILLVVGALMYGAKAEIIEAKGTFNKSIETDRE